ncbi:hypothetical protein FQN57_002079 [Myotisia sp. PD_48]|nr:hypothetical protein FQN57_002079 [Myotisia sp. PD_48]
MTIVGRIHANAMAVESCHDICTAPDRDAVGSIRALDHASRETLPLVEAQKYFNKEMLDILKLHQVVGVATMIRVEEEAASKLVSGAPTLQVGILGDEIGLGKTIVWHLLPRPNACLTNPHWSAFHQVRQIFDFAPNGQDEKAQRRRRHADSDSDLDQAQTPSKDNISRAQLLDSSIRLTRRRHKPSTVDRFAAGKSLDTESDEDMAYITKYTPKYPDIFARVIIDEAHILRHPNSSVSRIAKLLAPTFTWAVTATPLLNKTKDFYGYAHLMYNSAWDLELSSEYLDKGILERVTDACTPNELLDIFNPLYIQALAKDGRLQPRHASIIIPKLLRLSMIRRTAMPYVGGERIGAQIPKKVVRMVILELSAREQEDYATTHARLTAHGFNPGKDLTNEVSMHLLVHGPTMSTKISALLAKPFSGLAIFLSKSCHADDYHCRVPHTRVGRAIMMLHMSPVLRYLTKILFDVGHNQDERVVIFTQSPAVGWLIYMFILNWGAPVGWLRAGLSQFERDHMLSDFNKKSGVLRVIISTHTVGGFGINLQLSGCHHMVVVELPRNINTPLLQTQARLARLGQKEVNLASPYRPHLSTEAGKRQPDNMHDTAEAILNLMMDWRESRLFWDNPNSLDLSKSRLPRRLLQNFNAIDQKPLDIVVATRKRNMKSMRTIRR